jgi:hypothetical protein
MGESLHEVVLHHSKKLAVYSTTPILYATEAVFVFVKTLDEVDDMTRFELPGLISSLSNPGMMPISRHPACSRPICT